MRLRCSWFVNLSTTAGFFTWWSINLTYIRFCTYFINFHRGFFEPLHDFAQGVDTKYRESIAPGSRTGTGCSRGLPFGVSSGRQSSSSSTATKYFMCGIRRTSSPRTSTIFFSLWIGWTVYMRTPFWRAHEMDFVTVRWAHGFLQMSTDSCT